MTKIFRLGDNPLPWYESLPKEENDYTPDKPLGNNFFAVGQGESVVTSAKKSILVRELQGILVVGFTTRVEKTNSRTTYNIVDDSLTYVAVDAWDEFVSGLPDWVYPPLVQYLKTMSSVMTGAAEKFYNDA